MSLNEPAHGIPESYIGITIVDKQSRSLIVADIQHHKVEMVLIEK